MTDFLHNLLLVHTPERQGYADWEEVARLVAERAPEIDVRIADNRVVHSADRDWQRMRPMLVFSPHHLITFKPVRGKIYAGVQYTKAEQMARFETAGIATPRSISLSQARSEDQAAWGNVVIVKPLRGSRGEGVRCIQSRDIDHVRNQLGPLARKYLVQQFIDTGTRPSWYRVLTCFGRPLYAVRTFSDPAKPGEAVGPFGTYKLVPRGGQKRQFIDEPDVLEFARRMFSAMPDVPVHGSDILREASTGRLFAVESNPGGNTWHLSSPTGLRHKARGIDYYGQFKALEVVADELVKRTRAEAR